MAVKTYSAGVKEYRSTYWEPDYHAKDTDILACFKITPQPGVPREEAAAAVAAESSTGTWTTVWTDLLTDLDYYKGRAYRIEDVPGDDTCFYAFVAYPIDLFEEGSVVNVFTSLVGNVFGFKAHPRPAPGRRALPDRLRDDLRRPAHGHPGRARQSEQVRPAAAGLHHQAQAGPVGQELRPRGVRVPARRPGLHQGRRERQLAAVHALARPLRLRGRGDAQGRGGDRRAQGPLPERAPRRRRRRCTSAPSTPRNSARRSSCTTTSPAASAPTPASPTGAATTACCCTSTAPCTPCSTAIRTTASTSAC